MPLLELPGLGEFGFQGSDSCIHVGEDGRNSGLFGYAWKRTLNICQCCCAYVDNRITPVLCLLSVY